MTPKTEPIDCEPKARRRRVRKPRRVAMISMHTSPLDQPGVGDAGGMNVYVAELATALGRRGVEVEIFTRATSSAQSRVHEFAERVKVHHVLAGPFGGLEKDDLPGQLCAFVNDLEHIESTHPAGWYDVVHTHYWLSGLVGRLVADRWNAPLVHSMHTMAKVKNAALAPGDSPEPDGRVLGEEQIVSAADALIANTAEEAGQLVDLYRADPARVAVVPPGVDLNAFSPGGPEGKANARAELGLDPRAALVLFVGRIQPLKAPDVLVHAIAELVQWDRQMLTQPDEDFRATIGGRPLLLAVLGGPSGSGTRRPDWLQTLAGDLGVSGVVAFHPPVDRHLLAKWYRAADLVAVPSYSESFGLVAIEAQACGTPVVAAAVGGLRTAVADGHTGVLVPGHNPARWAKVLAELLGDEPRRAQLGAQAARHASQFGWDRSVEAMVQAYRNSARARAARLAGREVTTREQRTWLAR